MVLKNQKKKKINLYLANPRGFCAGVDRAIKMVEESLKIFGKPVYVRHEIVHNRYVVENMYFQIGDYFFSNMVYFRYVKPSSLSSLPCQMRNLLNPSISPHRIDSTYREDSLLNRSQSKEIYSNSRYPLLSV